MTVQITCIYVYVPYFSHCQDLCHFEVGLGWWRSVHSGDLHNVSFKGSEVALKLIHLPHPQEIFPVAGESGELPAQANQLSFTVDTVALQG